MTEQFNKETLHNIYYKRLQMIFFIVQPMLSELIFTCADIQSTDLHLCRDKFCSNLTGSRGSSGKASSSGSRSSRSKRFRNTPNRFDKVTTNRSGTQTAKLFLLF